MTKDAEKKQQSVSKLLAEYCSLIFPGSNESPEAIENGCARFQSKSFGKLRSLLDARVFDSFSEIKSVLSFAGIPSAFQRARDENFEGLGPAGLASNELYDLFLDEYRKPVFSKDTDFLIEGYQGTPTREDFEAYIVGMLQPYTYAFSNIHLIGRWRECNLRIRLSHNLEIDEAGCLAGTVDAHRRDQAIRRLRRDLAQVQGSLLVEGIASLTFNREDAFSTGYSWALKGRYGDAPVGEEHEGWEVLLDLEKLKDDSSLSAEEELQRRLRGVSALFSSTSEIAANLRHACLLYMKALKNNDPWERALFLSSCLEAALDSADGEEIKERLAAACALLVERRPAERESVREVIRSLYKARSDFAHGRSGTIHQVDDVRALAIVQQVLRGELAGIQSERDSE